MINSILKLLLATMCLPAFAQTETAGKSVDELAEVFTPKVKTRGASPLVKKSFSTRGVPKDILVRILEDESKFELETTEGTTVDAETLDPEEIQNQDLKVVTRINPTQAIVERSILFQVGTTDLKNSDARAAVAKIAALLMRPEMAGKAFMIEGHASAEGGEDENLSLSRERAMRIQKMLHDMGVTDCMPAESGNIS